jgi:hypothetical protein
LEPRVRPEQLASYFFLVVFFFLAAFFFLAMD